MKFKGVIKDLDKLVVTDPHYKSDVWCRYEKHFANKDNWNVEVLIKEVDEMMKYEGKDLHIQGIDFAIMLKSNKLENADKYSIKDIQDYKYIKRMDFKDFEVGIDTAQVCLGANSQAKEILEYSEKINSKEGLDVLDDYNPYFAIQTGSDGKLGTVKEGIINNEVQCIIIEGFFDDCAGQTIDSLKEYLEQQLEVEDLQEEKEKLKILYKETGKKPQVMEIENTLEAKQKLVGGLIEVVTYKDDMVLICNEEGKVYDMPPNVVFDNDYIAGNFFVVGDDYDNADFKSLTDKQILEAKQDLIDKSVQYDEIENTEEMECD